MRRAMLCLLALVLASAQFSGPARAQTSIDAPTGGPPTTVAGDGNGRYGDAAGAQLTAALDRALAELDGFPPRPTPDEVKSSTVRRRLLEVRLLMDFNAFAYDPVLMGTFRDAIDAAYEDIGTYQDIAVIQRILQTEVGPELVNERLVRMQVAVAPLRSPDVRGAMRGFFAAPSPSPLALEAKDVPRLWAFALATASDEYDSVGNLALLGSGVLRNLQGPDMFVADIFDPVQEERFHDVRKALRSVLLLTDMFPATREATSPVKAPLAELVSQYGDVNDAAVAYCLALALGVGVDAAADDLRREFQKTQARQQQGIDVRAVDVMIERLADVQHARRR